MERNMVYYEFPNPDDRERAIDNIYFVCGRCMKYDTVGSGGLYITDDGMNMPLAVRICETNGGRPLSAQV